MPRKLRMFCKIQDVKRAKNAYLMFSTANSSKAIEKNRFAGLLTYPVQAPSHLHRDSG